MYDKRAVTGHRERQRRPTFVTTRSSTGTGDPIRARRSNRTPPHTPSQNAVDEMAGRDEMRVAATAISTFDVPVCRSSTAICALLDAADRSNRVEDRVASGQELGPDVIAFTVLAVWLREHRGLAAVRRHALQAGGSRIRRKNNCPFLIPRGAAAERLARRTMAPSVRRRSRIFFIHPCHRRIRPTLRQARRIDR